MEDGVDALACLAHVSEHPEIALHGVDPLVAEIDGLAIEGAYGVAAANQLEAEVASQVAGGSRHQAVAELSGLGLLALRASQRRRQGYVESYQFTILLSCHAPPFQCATPLARDGLIDRWGGELSGLLPSAEGIRHKPRAPPATKMRSPRNFAVPGRLKPRPGVSGPRTRRRFPRLVTRSTKSHEQSPTICWSPGTSRGAARGLATKGAPCLRSFDLYTSLSSRR